MQFTFGALDEDIARIISETAKVNALEDGGYVLLNRFSDNIIDFNFVYSNDYSFKFIFEDKPVTIKKLVYYITVAKINSDHNTYYNIGINAYLDNDFHILSSYENEELFQAFRIPRLCINQIKRLYQDNTEDYMVTLKPVNINLFSYIREYKVQPRKEVINGLSIKQSDIL